MNSDFKECWSRQEKWCCNDKINDNIDENNVIKW